MKLIVRNEIIFLICIVVVVIAWSTCYSCSHFTFLEGMEKMGKMLKSANKEKESFSNITDMPYDLKTPPVNTSSWFTPNLSFTASKPYGKGAANIYNRPEQPIPLPPNEMLMFANTPFKPECCPNAFSNSMGCACMTVKQYDYLGNRGGNNVPYSEY